MGLLSGFGDALEGIGRSASSAVRGISGAASGLGRGLADVGKSVVKEGGRAIRQQLFPGIPNWAILGALAATAGAGMAGMGPAAGLLGPSQAAQLSAATGMSLAEAEAAIAAGAVKAPALGIGGALSGSTAGTGSGLLGKGLGTSLGSWAASNAAKMAAPQEPQYMGNYLDYQRDYINYQNQKQRVPVAPAQNPYFAMWSNGRD